MGRWTSLLLRAWRIDSVINTLYREFLGRGPTANELAANTGDLRLAKLPTSLDTLVQRLARHPEASAALGLRRFASAMPHPQGEHPPVVYAVSLGTHCYTSAMMARLSVKRFSTPFDWQFSSLDMVAHCLDDDFCTFLDKSQFEPVPIEKRPEGPNYNHCEHAFYRDRFGVRFVFNHADPTQEKAYAYLVRCVERMRSVLASAERKLFICVTRSTAYSNDALQRMSEALARRTANYELICVVVGPPAPGAFLPLLAPLDGVSGVQLYQLRPLSQMGGVRFDDPVDEVAFVRLLLPYEFKQKPIEFQAAAGGAPTLDGGDRPSSVSRVTVPVPPRSERA